MTEKKKWWERVGEGLPKKNEQVLCFLQDASGNTFQGQGCWFGFGEAVLWLVAGMRIGETGTWKMLAWMPLPAPYRAE